MDGWIDGWMDWRMMDAIWWEWFPTWRLSKTFHGYRVGTVNAALNTWKLGLSVPTNSEDFCLWNVCITLHPYVLHHKPLNEACSRAANGSRVSCWSLFEIRFLTAMAGSWCLPNSNFTGQFCSDEILGWCGSTKALPYNNEVIWVTELRLLFKWQAVKTSALTRHQQ